MQGFKDSSDIQDTCVVYELKKIPSYAQFPKKMQIHFGIQKFRLRERLALVQGQDMSPDSSNADQDTSRSPIDGP